MFRDIHLRAQQTARIERSRNLTAIPAIFLGLAIWFSKTERGNFRDFPLLQGAEAYSRLTSTLSTIRLGLPYPQPTIRCRCRIWERNRPFPRCKPGVNLPRFAFPLGNRLPRPTKSPQGRPLGRPFQLKPPPLSMTTGLAAVRASACSGLPFAGGIARPESPTSGPAERDQNRR